VRGVGGVTRPFAFNELIGTQGGLTALHFAARQGGARAVDALVAHGANVNALTPGDRVSPLLIAAVNGQFDIAAYLLAHGANPNLANAGGVTPLFAVLNIEWAPRMFYPQPRAQLQQTTSYLDLMTRLLDAGADPNARVTKKTWFTQYNFDLLRVDDQGATPFWRAAYASDITAMQLLLRYGADPSIATIKPFARPRGTDADRDAPAVDVSGRPLPTGGPGIPPLLADKIVRIEPARQISNLHGLARLQQRQHQARRALRRPLSRLVAVKAEHRHVTHPPEQRHVVFRERRPHRRDRPLEPRHHR